MINERIETDRLYAEKITNDDYDKLVALHTNEDVMSTLGGTRSKEEILTYLDWNVSLWQVHGFGLWIFYCKETNKWVGIGGLRNIRILNQKHVEVCYELLPDYWQQGFATEIAEAGVKAAFEQMKLKELIGFTQATNNASRRIMEKLGFKYKHIFDHRGSPNALYILINS